MNQNLRALCESACDAQDEAIRICCGEAELPEREAEAACQLLCSVNRRLRGEHRRCAVLELRCDCADECGWGVSRHRRSVTKCEVQIDLAICVGNLRTACGDGIRRNR